MIRRFLSFSLLILTMLTVCAARVDTISVPTKYMPAPVKATVVVPTTEKDAYPVVYLLNGYDGDHLSWIGITCRNLPELADKYEMIFVCPDGQDSWYWDAPANPQVKMESFIVNDLVPIIDNGYPTIANAANRAITGLSMGGHGAMWLAFRHPDVWGNVGSMSGGVDIRPFPKSWKMERALGSQAQYPQRWEEHTVINLVPQLQRDALNIIFDCGTEDFFFKVNSNLHQALLDHGIEHTWSSRPGKHTHSYWRESLPQHLDFFNRHFTRK